MGLHDVAPTVIINSICTTFLVLCIPVQTLQSDESIVSSFSKGTMKSSTGFDQLVPFDPSSQYTFANYNGSDISAGVVSIGVDFSSRMSNEYEDTTLDFIPAYSGTVEPVYSIESPIYTVTWIPTHPSAVFAGSSDIYHLTLALESSFLLSSIVIPIMSIVTSSFVQHMDVSVLKHQSYDSNFATTFLDHDLVPLEGISSVKSLSTVNASEIAPISLIDTLVMHTGTTELLKSSFATFATSCSLPYSTSLHDDHISSLHINITDEIQRTYQNVPGNSVNSSIESLVEQWSGWIQPTRTQTQVETESLDSVLSTSYSNSGFVTEFFSVVTAFISVANADQISYNFQTSSLVHTGNLKFETFNTKYFKLPSPVYGSFQATERMYTTEMMDDYLSIQTNTGVTSIYYSISDVPLYSDMPNGAFLSSSHPHASTTRSIQASFDTRAAQDFSKSDFFSFTTGYSVQNISGGMFRASLVTDTAAESFLVTDFATELSASPINSTPSQTSFHDEGVAETSQVSGPSFTKSSLNTHKIYKTSLVELDNDQNWDGQDVGSNSQNGVSAGTQLELLIVIGAIAGFAVVLFVFIVIACLCKQCCSSNPQSVGIPHKMTLTNRADAAKQTITMTHFVKVAPMQVMTKRKVFVDA